MFVQQASLKLDSLNVETSVYVVFGIEDNLVSDLKSDSTTSWTIMNQPWTQFSTKYGITSEDLWPALDSMATGRTLSTAKLYPIFNLDLSKDEMLHLSRFFWLELIDDEYQPNTTSMVAKWRHSVRLSLEEIESHVNLEKLLGNRRHLFNLVATQSLVDSIVNNTPITFGSLIRNAVRDGYAHHVLNLLDDGTLLSFLKF